MSEVWCFDCQNVFDSHQGHHCMHGWRIPKNLDWKDSYFSTKVLNNDCENQLIFPATEEECSYPISVINELGNSAVGFSAQTDITYLHTKIGIPLCQSLNCESEKNKLQFMVPDSIQTCKEDCTKRETGVKEESFNHPGSIIGCNLLLDSSIRHSRILGDKYGTNDISSQFSTIEESSMSNSHNNNFDFIQNSMNIDSLMLNKTGSTFSSKGYQLRSNAESDQLLSENNQDHSKERKRNTEIESKIFAPNYEKLSTEINHQFSVSRQIVHDSVWEHYLENMSNHVTIKKYNPNLHLHSRYMSAVEMTHDCSFTSSLNFHENDFTIGDQIYHADQKENSPEEILNQYPSESIKNCFSDATATVAGPPCSLDSERTCSICRKEFSSKTYLKRHYQVHSGARPFVCNICQRKFTDKSNLNRHVRLVHMGEKLQCKICGTTFAIKNALEAHIQIHNREKHKKCDICGKLFTRKYSLRVHIRLHTGEKPYKCDVCSRSFALKKHLIDHLKRLHLVT